VSQVVQILRVDSLLVCRVYYCRGCESLEYIPPEARKDRIIILAKSLFNLPVSFPYSDEVIDQLIYPSSLSLVYICLESNYFHNFPAFDPTTFFTRLENHTSYELVSTADQEDGFPMPDGLASLGLMPKANYDHLLVSNKKKDLGSS
jgi:hypothetical protein